MSAFENTPNNKEQLPETQQEEQLEKKPFKVFQGETVLVKGSDGSIENDWMVSETPFPEEEFVKVYKKDPENPENTITKGVLRSDMESMNGSEVDFGQAEDLDSLIKLIEKQGSLSGTSQEYSADTLKEIIGKVESGELETKMLTRAGGLRDAFEKIINTEKKDKEAINVVEIENQKKVFSKDTDQAPSLIELNSPDKNTLEKMNSAINDDLFIFNNLEVDFESIPNSNKESFKATLKKEVEKQLHQVSMLREITSESYRSESLKKLLDLNSSFPHSGENSYQMHYDLLKEKFPFIIKREALLSELEEKEDTLPKNEYLATKRGYEKALNDYEFSELCKSLNVEYLIETPEKEDIQIDSGILRDRLNEFSEQGISENYFEENIEKITSFIGQEYGDSLWTPIALAGAPLDFYDMYKNQIPKDLFMEIKQAKEFLKVKYNLMDSISQESQKEAEKKLLNIEKKDSLSESQYKEVSEVTNEKIESNQIYKKEASKEKSPLEMINLHKEYLAYQDVNPEGPIDYALNEEGVLEEGKYKNYTESLSDILDSERAESLEAVKGTIRNYYEHIKQNLGLEDTIFGKSDSWIYWDIAKQGYMVNNPESSRPEYLLADPLDFENSSESRALIQQIADRHIGWEISNPNILNNFDTKNLSQRALALIKKAERNPGSQALSSMEYSELGRLVREANKQENIFN
jgi:hypothetical protein